MKLLSTLVLSLLVSLFTYAQNFNGQWKGGFVDNSSPLSGLATNSIEYVLELECTGKEVSGYSYTYFSEGTKPYYTICKLKGTINHSSREIMVSEIERTKFNTPPDFRNCFQTHLLKYSKLNSDTEQLTGSWIPAPNQLGDCGKGRTILYRRIFKKLNHINTASISNKTTLHQNSNIKKAAPQINDRKKTDFTKAPVVSQPMKKVDTVKEQTVITPPKIINNEKSIDPGTFQPRTKSLIKTLEISQDKFTVDFYDNGAVDGDSITVFYNGKIIVSHLGLTEKPASFTLSIDKSLPYNELVMYAENLGTIPPNTALMVVKDGVKQYEVNITSDTERSGTIRFHYKKPE